MKARTTEAPGAGLLRLSVDRLNSKAEGVCRHEGRVVFVPGALPGETVEVRIIKNHRSCAVAELARVLNESPERRIPPCPVYPQCGGCDCQHMSYEASLRFKRDVVRDALARIGGVNFPVPEPEPAPSPWQYRNKSAMPVREAEGRPAAGFFTRGSHRIVPVRRCLIAMPSHDEAAAAVLAWMAEEGVAPYEETLGTGTVRHILSRASRAGQVMVTLAVNGALKGDPERLTDMLRQAVPGLVSVNLSVNTRRDNVIPGADSQTLWGQPRMEDRLCGLRFLVSPLSFFQVNPVQAERLYEKALKLAAPGGEDVAADLFCGTGTITLLLAARAARAYGIELSPQAVRDARQNAALNGIRNADFLEGAAEKVLPELLRGGVRPDIVTVDPPRKGIGEAVLGAVAEAAPKRVVYISCHPATQARDVRQLTQAGYRVDAVVPVDMFCQTAHVETVLRLTRD